MAYQGLSKWFLFILLAALTSSSTRLVAGELPPNVESIQVAEPAVAAVAPDAAAAAPVAAATPAVVAAPVAAAPVVETVAAPVNGISGTTTEHKNPDGSIVTVTKFNGQLPANAYHQHFPQMFSSIGSFGNPFYGFGSPLYPTYNGGQFRSIRSVSDNDGSDREERATKDSNGNQNSSPNTDDKKPHMEKRQRVSEKFHYPSPAPEYFSIHKRPFVPVIDNEFSDLI